MAVFGELGIGILLGGGAFDAADVALTGSLLAAFAISVPFESLSHLLSRAIYATRHTMLQVLASIAGLAVTIVATLVLVDCGRASWRCRSGSGSARHRRRPCSPSRSASGCGAWRAELRAPGASSA